MPNYEPMQRGYSALWDRARVDRAAEARKAAQRIFANKTRYKAITAKTGIPYHTIGSKHYRESNLNFATHLHCGDPLTRRTVHVPKGRPATGSPPFTFEFSAIDALTMPPHRLEQVKRWSVERTLYEDEKYNGWGYLGKGNSPYVWSGTTVYTGGKYVADHVYSSTVKDSQLGTAAIYIELAKIDPEVAKALKDREGNPPQDVVDEQLSNNTKKEKRAGTAAASEATVSGTTKATEDTHHWSVAKGIILPIAIGLGVAIMIVCLLSYLKKRKSIPAQVAQKWSLDYADPIVEHVRSQRKKRRMRRKQS